nr:Xaa-Pro peptidase family protein [Maliibacterium massiliense]
MQHRIARLFAGADAYDAYIVLAPENVRYFSGFTGEGMLLLTPQRATLVTDGRYSVQADLELARADKLAFSVRVTDAVHDHAALLALAVEEAGARRVGFEDDVWTVAQHARLAACLPEGAVLCGVGDAFTRMRMVKDEQELSCIARAARIADEAFAHILTFIRPGVTERAVALELDAFMQRQGASGSSFGTIVASGPNAAMPHAVPGERALRAGDVVTMDFGCVYEGYCSDMTRTIAIGAISPVLKDIYNLVLFAQLSVLAALAPGKTGRQMDAVARGIIADAGHAEHFGHGLGHGVGLQIHELPRLSQVQGDIVLAPGHVVTVEPGVYLPDAGGVRIEDLCVITTDGARTLSAAPKELIVL